MPGWIATTTVIQAIGDLDEFEEALEHIEATMTSSSNASTAAT